MKLFDGWTKEEIAEWLNRGDDPEGCVACGAMAGCCKDYPNCPGNPEYRPPLEAEPKP